MYKEEALDYLLRKLKNSPSINAIFDVKSLDNYNLFYKISENKIFDFLQKNLILLVDDFAIYANRDFYEDKEFHEIVLLLQNLDLKSLFLSKNINLYKYLILHLLLILFLCTGYMELNTHTSKTLDEFILDFKNNHGLNKNLQYFWYRGVTNLNFDLIPSMYRTINDPHLFINNSEIDKMYSKNDSRNQYIKIFGPITNENDYWAYMQHSVAFSPLLDFTTNINIAGSFAVSFTNPNSYVYDDAGIYLLVRDHKLDYRRRKINIELFNEKLTASTFIFGKPLLFCTIQDFMVKYSVLNSQTNDRMKYQKGLFIKIYKAVFVNKKLLFPNSSTLLFYIKIPPTGKPLNKDSVRNDIERNHQEYLPENLMDPYKWFNKKH